MIITWIECDSVKLIWLNCLLIKSVIGHIVILHSSIPADSSPLTIYLNNIQNCHTHFLLTSPSDNESVIMSALTSVEQLTR